ncbi:MAG: DNA cytosine methyltransferase [Muribaculaceae bacterium]|nr:DNA cytosine methyltransferase [Muribaculaceae bacterium]
MRVVDLFSGCGGLSLGFTKAGMDIVAAYDNWAAASSVYAANFNHPINTFDLADEESAASHISQYNPDMIIGGPPCQDFSSAGLRNEDNGRGNLTLSYAGIVARIRPKWFVMENVSTITKTNKLVGARAIFKDAGYGLTQTVLNAALCGVPQKRKRFFLIGKLGEEDEFLLPYLNQNMAKKEMTVKDYLGDRIDFEYYYRHPRSYARRGVFSVNEPSPTIRGVNRPIPAGYPLHKNDPVRSLEGIRPLTTKERSLIQTFPEDFVFKGSKSEIEQMIGNAVPVNLGRFVAIAINNYIGNHNDNSTSGSTTNIFNYK